MMYVKMSGPVVLVVSPVYCLGMYVQHLETQLLSEDRDDITFVSNFGVR